MNYIYIVLFVGSLVLGFFYFFGVQYYLSKAAVSGDEKVQDAIAGDFRRGWKRYDFFRLSSTDCHDLGCECESYKYSTTPAIADQTNRWPRCPPAGTLIHKVVPRHQ